MKHILFLIVITCLMFCFGCGGNMVPNNAVPPPSASPTQPTPVPTSTQPKDGNYPSRGVVTKINTQLGSIELDHEEIVGVMPPMIMEFYVRDKALLDGLAVGDRVEFVLEYKHPAETIVSVKKIK